MKNKFLKIFIGFLVLLFPLTLKAASASISVSGTSSAVVGSTVTVNVTLSSSTPIGAWEFLINYDSSALKLISGKTKVADYAQSSGGVSSKSYTLKFTALKSGNTKVSVGSYLAWAYSDNSPMSISAGSKSIKIMTQAELEATYSKNNNLSSIKVNGYEITPSFDKKTTEYKVELPSNVESIEVSATAEDRAASVSGIGTIQVAEGENKIEIICTAENGSTQKYTLIANVVDNNPIEVTVDNQKYTVVKRASSLTKPDTFTEKTVKINDIDIPAFYNEITKYTLVGLKDSNSNISLFVYDESNKNYKPYKEVKFPSITFFPEKAENIIEGYIETKIKINDIEVIAYKKEDIKDFYLIYGTNIETGVSNWYQYDVQTNLISRYNSDIVEYYEERLHTFTIIICVLSIESLILLLVIIILAKRKKKKLKNISNEIKLSKPEEKKKDKRIKKEVNNEKSEEIEQESLKDIETKKIKKKKLSITQQFDSF